MVDVPGGADRQRNERQEAEIDARRAEARRGRPRRPRPPSASARPGEACRRARSDDRRARPGEVPARLSSIAHAALSSSAERQRAAADPRDGLLDLAADEAGEAVGPLAHGSTGSSSIRRTGISARASSRSARSASVPSSAASVSLSARSARRSGWRRSRSTRSAEPTTIPACGAAEELVAREADEVGAAATSPRRRLVPEVEQRRSRGRRRAGARRSTRSGRASCRDDLGEADDAQFDLVHAEDRRRSGRSYAAAAARACSSPPSPSRRPPGRQDRSGTVSISSAPAAPRR